MKSLRRELFDAADRPRHQHLIGGTGSRGQVGGAKNSRAIPSGSRKETPEP